MADSGVRAGWPRSLVRSKRKQNVHKGGRAMEPILCRSIKPEMEGEEGNIVDFLVLSHGHDDEPTWAEASRAVVAVVVWESSHSMTTEPLGLLEAIV